MNPQPASGNSGSVSDTLKNYVNNAMAKGQVAYESAKILGHKAHEQINQAKVQAQAATTHAAQQQSNNQAATQVTPGAVAGAQAAPQMAMGNQDAFSDLNQFNAHATADNAAYLAQKAQQQAAANATSKTSQSTM